MPIPFSPVFRRVFFFLKLLKPSHNSIQNDFSIKTDTFPNAFSALLNSLNIITNSRQASQTDTSKQMLDVLLISMITKEAKHRSGGSW